MREFTRIKAGSWAIKLHFVLFCLAWFGGRSGGFAAADSVFLLGMLMEEHKEVGRLRRKELYL